jgi:adenine-specific DNA-methyltransferase
MPKPKKSIDTSKLLQVDAYTHDEYDRANIPPVGMAQYDMAASPEEKYDYDPHIDPSLQWAGKKEGTSFTVPTSSIHIHEVINPHKIIRSVQTIGEDARELQGELFESDLDRMKKRNSQIEFYRHKNKWTNRLIAGDSLARVLKAEIDQYLIEKYRGVESLPFTVKENTLVAVKIVDDRGIESLKIIPVGEK